MYLYVCIGCDLVVPYTHHLYVILIYVSTAELKEVHYATRMLCSLH